jgi:hypothetical protein
VRLPAEWGARRLEALHELAWRDLLDLAPGAAQALADLAAARTGTTATGLALNAEVRFAGGCGSDLFLACSECDGDRAVIEIKGPGAAMNPSKKGIWQTDVYRGRYRANPALVCGHLPGISPLFILLDARNRSRQAIEQEEGVYIRLSLDGWAVLTYEEALSLAPFQDHPLASWLLGC